MLNPLPDIYMIVGPTAAGKSALAMEMAHRLNTEIISADAFQVYRGMTIGTAKLLPSEQEGIVHHLINILNPDQPYSVTEFLKRLTPLVDQLQNAGKPVIICGGTGFYLNAFLRRFEFAASPSDATIKQTLENEASNQTPLEFWKQLNTIDPAAAQTIHPNNTKRVLRALEIYRTTRQLPSSQQYSSPPREDVQIIGLDVPRDELYKQINSRVDMMIRSGLVDEVERLLKKGYAPDLFAFQAIGYKEVISYLNGSTSREEMIECVKLKTRRFAKRQMTWFTRFPNVKWHNPSSL